MPIGVPKIPFQIWGDDEANWLDIYNVLYRKRLLFICGEISALNANLIVGVIVYLSIEDKTRDQYIFVNSLGGSLSGGIAIYDIIQVVKPTIQTMALGTVASMASLIVIGGTTKRRIAFPNARVMMHQPATGFFMAPVTDLLKEVEFMLRARETITSIYAIKTGKPFGIIWADMERDLYMSATEAKDYGIVDSIGEMNRSSRGFDYILKPSEELSLVKD